MTIKCVFASVALVLISVTYAEEVKFRKCPSEREVPYSCTVHNVRVDPCKEAENEKPCKLKRGSNASISFDYTANFEAGALESRAYWTNQVTDLAFLGMDTDACKTTPCPVVPGQKQTYSIALPIAKSYPARQFDVKWRLWKKKENEQENKPEEECCFIFQIKIIRV